MVRLTEAERVLLKRLREEFRNRRTPGWGSESADYMACFLGWSSLPWMTFLQNAEANPATFKNFLTHHATQRLLK